LPIRLPFICARSIRILGALIAAALMLNGPVRAAPSASGSAQSLIDEAAAALRVDPEAGRRAAQAAVDVLRRAPDADLEIRARLLLCDYYAERDGAQAMAQVAAASALLPEAHRSALRAGVLNCQGEAAETMGANARAAQFYDQAVHVAQDASDAEMLAEALASRGYLRGLSGEFAQGLSDLRQAQALYEQQNMAQLALDALNGIAIVYNRMGDYTEAAQIFTRTVQSLHDAGLTREEAVTWHNLARAQENLQQWEPARHSYSNALELSTQLGYTRGEAYALRGLASVANATGNPNGALSLLQRSTQMQRLTPDARLLAQIDLTGAQALHALQRLKESASLLEQALNVFRQADSPGELAASYDELAAVRAELGEWRAAYDARTLAQSTATRLLRNQLDQRFAALKVEYDTDAQAKRNAILIRENEATEKALAQQRIAGNLQTLVIVLGVLLLGALAVLAVYQRRNSARLRTLAMTDELTSLPNRRAVLTRLTRMLSDSVAPTSILIIDVDHFKTINDRHGHLVGDETLKLLTANLREALTEPAFFGRLGGEEFAVVLPATDVERASESAERLRERVMRLDLSRWLGERRITVSIGVASSVPGRDTISSMLRRADAALYAAKDDGRNCVRCDAAAILEAASRVA